MFGWQWRQMKERGSQREGDGSAPVDIRNPSRPYHWNHRPHGVLQALGRARHLGGSATRPVSKAGALPRSHHSNCSATFGAACLRSAHSQTVATRQPAWSKSWQLRRSRSVFASNFARQNSWRVVGVVAYWHPACRCQKQPCTKHTAPNRRNTRSGVPGRLRSWRRYRSPRAWMARRRASSGRVFLLPIPAIMRERVARSTMSAIVVAARPSEEDGRQQATREIPDVKQFVGMLGRRTELDWSARPRCRAAAARDGAAVSPHGFRAVSPQECDS